MTLPRTIHRVLIAAVCLVPLAPASAVAGEPLDPNIGDESLGTAGGLRYRTDGASFDASTGYGQADVGCGGPRWHLLGGGTVAAGPFGQAWLSANRPLDYDDADLAGDDGWYAGGYGPPGTDGITGYTACIRDRTIRYRQVTAASDPSGDRTESIDCGGGRWHLASGSVFIATSKSWTTSSYPTDGVDADRTPDDVWVGRAWDTVGGIGGLYLYAVCVRGNDLRYVRGRATSVEAGATLVRRVGCANDEHVVGGGARVGGPADEARLVASIPYDDGDAALVPDDGWRIRADNLSGSDKRITPFAVCMM